MRILRKKVLKMKLKTDNPIPVKTRLKELFGDFLFISGYLIALFLLAMGFYSLILGGIPAFTEAQSQLLAFSTSVLPLTIIFAWLDFQPFLDSLPLGVSLPIYPLSPWERVRERAVSASLL